MKKNTMWAMAAGLILIAAVLTWGLSNTPVAVAGETWSITADLAESCNCNPACPCIFGSPSTNAHCEGSRLVEIEKGHFEGVRLDGVPVVITFRMGGFVEYHVSDKATDEQVEAAAKLMSAAFPPMAEWGVRGTEKVAISIERTATRLKFSTPTATVDIEVMEGASGKPVKVHDLPADFLVDYTHYVARENSHKDGDHDFSYEGTNGFTSRLKAKG